MVLTNLGSHSQDSTPCALAQFQGWVVWLTSRSTYLHTSATAVASRAYLLLTITYLTGEGPLALSPLYAPSGIGLPGSVLGSSGPTELYWLPEPTCGLTWPTS